MSNKKAKIGLFLIIILLAVGFFTGFWVLRASFLPIQTVTTQIDSAGQIIDKTYDADNAIYNYEWFKTQYEKIQAIRTQIIQAKMQIDDLKSTYGTNAANWTQDVREENFRLSSIKTGLINQESNLIDDYNARAKMANRAIFQDKLPLSVDKMLW